MRATVNVDDEIFAQADALAAELGISRSRLYQQALTALLRERRERALTEQADRLAVGGPGARDRRVAEYVETIWDADMGDDDW